MTKYSLDDIVTTIAALAAKINAPYGSLPTYNFPIGDATPYIEVDDEGFMYFIISERGTEFSREKFDNRELRNQGYSEEDIDKIAYAKYPKNEKNTEKE